MRIRVVGCSWVLDWAQGHHWHLFDTWQRLLTGTGAGRTPSSASSCSAGAAAAGIFAAFLRGRPFAPAP